MIDDAQLYYMNLIPRILIAGVGNSFRNDDGIGPYICRCIEEKEFPCVTAICYHQLHTELIEAFLQFDSVIVADAAVTGELVEFYPLKEITTGPASSSHHVNASLLLQLAKQLYKKDLNIMVCSVLGYDYEMGETLSEAGKNNADKAVSIITDWLNKQLT